MSITERINITKRSFVTEILELNFSHLFESFHSKLHKLRSMNDDKRNTRLLQVDNWSITATLDFVESTEYNMNCYGCKRNSLKRFYCFTVDFRTLQNNFERMLLKHRRPICWWCLLLLPLFCTRNGNISVWSFSVGWIYLISYSLSKRKSFLKNFMRTNFF